MQRPSSQGDQRSARQHARVSRAMLAPIVALALAAVSHAPARAAEPDKGGTIVWAVHEYMPGYDIAFNTSYTGTQPMGPLYNSLLTRDVRDGNKIVGELAERWEIGADGKRVTFRLRRGVKFHDGSDFTCADAQYTLDRLADPARAYVSVTGFFKPVYESSRCVDDHTLVLSLKRPSAGLLAFLSGGGAGIMKRDIDKRADRKSPAFLVGTGPFKYKTHNAGVDFQAERNPHYWKPGVVHLDGYRAVVMGDLTKIFASFRARQLTMTGIARHLEKPEADILKKDFPEAVVAVGPRACWDNYVMNLTKPPFNDVRVRRAVALATDREKMIQIAVEGWGELGGFVSPYLPFGLPIEELKQLPQFQPDMEKRRAEAKRLLAEAGYPKGLTVELLLRRGPLYEPAAMSRQDDLKKVGITEKVVLLDTAAMRQRSTKQDFEVFTMPDAVGSDDADVYYARFDCESGVNMGRYCNPEIDRLHRAQTEEFDPKKRIEITRKMERILLHDVPDDRGYYWMSSMGYWNRVQNWPAITGTTVYNFGKFEKVWCKGGKCM
jgi:peptide/nickel transport system substrate-binding protein